MTKFQFICKCYAITCNTCKVYAYSFFVLWFVHSFLCQFLTESLQNFKGGRWQMNFRLPKYYIINIFKLEYLRYLLSDWDQTCFGISRMTVFYFWRITFKVTSGLADMTSLSFQLRISLLFYVLLNHNLVTEVRLVHFFILNIMWRWRSLWPWGQWQGKCIFFFYRLVCPFITPSILDRITSNYQLWALIKELPVG